MSLATGLFPTGRQSGLLFDWRAEDRSLTARSGQVGTLTRAGAGTLVDVNGVLLSSPDNQPRFGYHNGYFGLLLELAQRNLVLQSEALTTAPWGSNSGSEVKNTGQIDPTGGTAALLLGNGGATSSAQTQTISFTGDGTKSAAVYVKAGSAVNSVVTLRDNTASTNRGRIDITWSSGVPSANAVVGSLLGIDVLNNGWYRIRFMAPAVVAANSNAIYLYPENSTTSANCYFFRPMAVDAPSITSSVPTAAVTVNRPADVFTFPFPFANLVQDFTVLLTALIPSSPGGFQNLVGIGTTGNGAELWIGTGASMNAEIRGTPNAPTGSLGIAAGAPISVCAQYTGWSSGPTARLDVGGGFGAVGAVGNARTALGSSTINVNNGSHGAGIFLLQAVKIAAGSKTRTQMLEAA
jgi:hypothetical protein